MKIGSLDRRITVQKPTESRDDYGGLITTWATFAVRWAALSYRRANTEDYPADKKTSFYRAMFTVRSDSVTRQITPKMRIVYDGKVWDIHAITEKMTELRKMYLLIEVEANDTELNTTASAIGDEANAGVWGWEEDV